MFPLEASIPPEEEPKKPGWFPPTTQSIWSDIKQASDNDHEKAQAALERLTVRYRDSIDGFFRRQRTVDYLKSFGCTDEAEDLASEFILTHLFHRKILGNYARRNAKFRSFLIQCLKSFVRDKRRGLEAAMRNSGRPPISLDQPVEEGGAGDVGAMPEEVEHSLDVEFASSLSQQAMAALGKEETRNSAGIDRWCRLR